MPVIDWQELYASNRAVIERAGLAPLEPPTLGAAIHSPPGHPATKLPRRARSRRAPRTAGQLNDRTFTFAGRTRRALVHPPADIEPDTTVPLVCLLHGCSQDAATFAAATLMNEAADRHGFLAVYPQQTRGENGQGCWNWFLPEHQARGAGQPASIAGVVRELLGKTSPWAIDTRRIFVAGFSAGGAMAAVLAATYPDLFTGLAVHSGLAYRSATSLGAAFNAMARGADNLRPQTVPADAGLARPVPSIVIHGAADTVVAPINAKQVLQQSMAANGRPDLDIERPTTSSRHQSTGGRAYSRQQWADRHGALMHELLMVDGLGHDWSGGRPGGSHTDPRGPDAGEAIWRFFAQATTDRPTA